MTLLHAQFHLRNQQAFQRLLDTSNNGGQPTTAALSSSAGKSWPKSTIQSADVNTRDFLGRTALHLACAAVGSSEYVRLLLRHPAISVNIQDTESHWTPLHRAIYFGNLEAVLLLLQHSDIDATIRDFEGNTAFDLYNSTVECTAPLFDPSGSELFTWGANRNAALGLGDADDRVYPDQVSLISNSDNANLDTIPIKHRFSPLLTRQVEMSRLHTVFVTSESKANIYICGFGSGGRLGPAQNTQYTLKPLLQSTLAVVAVALGQDHSLVLTNDGDVYSWGLNRFCQLGYVVESSPGISLARTEEPIQYTPRKVHGPLKKERVKGVAASKTASACWTATDVFTWGTNNGQLGYDKAAQPTQILPRIVSKVVHPVVSIALTDTAMACLLITHDVICIWDDRSLKINFPAHGFPLDISYKPPQVAKAAHIAKITSCDDLFAALSSNGELFTFSVPINDAAQGKGIKPQRVWALRKQFSAVKDVAIGSEGSIIICTKSGHVFVRSRTSNTKATTKFQRVPYIQRAVAVCANSTGAFGALRAEFKTQTIELQGPTIEADFASLRPYLIVQPAEVLLGSGWDDEPGIDDEFKKNMRRDGRDLGQLIALLHLAKKPRLDGRENNRIVPHTRGTDALLVLPLGGSLPVHRAILGVRSSVLRGVLKRSDMVKNGRISIRVMTSQNLIPSVHVTGCRTITVLLLLHYIYTDNILAVWDSQRFHSSTVPNGGTSREIKDELETLGHLLNMPTLVHRLQNPLRQDVVSSVIADVRTLYDVETTTIRATPLDPLHPDVILSLADREVYCHSISLRCRTEFFSSFFDEAVWTERRIDANGVVRVNLQHLHWDVMQYVLRFICRGEDEEMFEYISSQDGTGPGASVDRLLDFMFRVLDAANELLVDRLVLICCRVILNFCNVFNACYILTEATHFKVIPLIERVQKYISVNLESFLESHLLDCLAPHVAKELGAYIRHEQHSKSPTIRGGRIEERAMSMYGDWLAMQDIPEPIIPTQRLRKSPSTARLQPSSPKALLRQRSIVGSSLPSSLLEEKEKEKKKQQLSSDDVFDMDDIAVDSGPTSPPHVWKAASVPKTDMRAIFAEASSVSPTKGTGKELGTQTKARMPAPPQPPSRSTSSPWNIQTSQPVTPASPSPSPANLRQVGQGSMRGKATASTPPSASTPSRRTSQVDLGLGPRPGFGPVISPVRQPSAVASSSFSRKSSGSGKAWTASANIDPPTVSTKGMSFVAIQQLQLDYQEPVKEKRTLLEIQEEEQAKRVEADFLKWWAEEEARAKVPVTPPPRQPRPKVKKQGRAKKAQIV